MDWNKPRLLRFPSAVVFCPQNLVSSRDFRRPE